MSKPEAEEPDSQAITKLPSGSAAIVERNWNGGEFGFVTMNSPVVGLPAFRRGVPSALNRLAQISNVLVGPV